MIQIPMKDPFYETVLADHRHLCGLVSALQGRFNACAEGRAGAARQDLPRMLEELLKHLQLHFATEEAGGMLEEAVCRLPRLSRQAMALEREHAPLLEQLGAIVKTARESGDLQPMCQELNGQFKEFCHDLLAHEGAENRLAAEAFQGETM
jgi:hemerythrin